MEKGLVKATEPQDLVGVVLRRGQVVLRLLLQLLRLGMLQEILLGTQKALSKHQTLLQLTKNFPADRIKFVKVFSRL